MQKFALVLVSGFLLLQSCSNDFDLTTEWQDIPVIFGILSPADTAQYFRVEKAFVDPNQSALEIAQIPDSLYYDEVDVSLLHVTTGDRVVLERVVGEDEGYPREDGIFAAVPNILYKLGEGELELKGGDRYRIIVQRGEPKPEISAEITQVGKPSIRKSTLPQNIRFEYNSNFRLSWTDVGAAFYDVTLIFEYREWHVLTPNEVEHLTLNWKYAHRVKDDEASMMGREFYERLASELDSDPQIRRSFTSLGFMVESAGDEIEEMIRISQANTGITSVGEIPQYSNIEGGRGIFSSKHEDVVTELNLHPATIDSLQNGSITGDLNFQ